MSDDVEVVDTEQTEVDPVSMLRQENQDTIQGLAGEGIGIDPNVFVNIGFDTLLNLLFPPGGPLRHIYEAQFNIALRDFLNEQATAARQQKLLEGVRQ